MEKVKAVLHAHPYFYSPQKNGTPIDQRVYEFFSKPPRLWNIVKHAMKNGIGICAISACHSPTGGMDTRFESYMKQLGKLGPQYEVDAHLNEGWVQIIAEKPLIILNSQEIRTDYKGKPADINVIGVKRLIPHSLDIDETARIGREEGGLVTICHGNSTRFSAGIDKTIEMVKTQKAHTAEGFNATEKPKVNKQLMQKLTQEGIKWIAVPDSYHYKQNGAAGVIFP